MKKLHWSWIVTFIWVGIVIVVPIFCSSIDKPSKLNEWGDYLAGAFSPLAFFWLIMGYLQQGKELKNSIEEQRNSVEEQKNIGKHQENQVKILQEQLQKNLEWQEVQMNQREPYFILEALNSNTIKIKNIGGEARYLQESAIYIKGCSQLKYGDVVQFSIDKELSGVLTIKYMNYLNQKYYVRFKIFKNDDSTYAFQQSTVVKISDN
ncbi:hypothetical protein GCM10027155_07170 [Acinetobacter apis]|uniref:Uncharacterized protein n=1 Tax=Acinetobacter apis TaxID=1229165 RepID=A0A217EF19_9GAMM|nr:hypothetical protein [Acinetobacter apis]SNQ28800.1 hypothetical protein SAMN05444584_0727 [Acinetobacter apis]